MGCPWSNYIPDLQVDVTTDLYLKALAGHGVPVFLPGEQTSTSILRWQHWELHLYANSYYALSTLCQTLDQMPNIHYLKNILSSFKVDTVFFALGIRKPGFRLRTCLRSHSSWATGPVFQLKWVWFCNHCTVPTFCSPFPVGRIWSDFRQMHFMLSEGKPKILNCLRLKCKVSGLFLYFIPSHESINKPV